MANLVRPPRRSSTERLVQTRLNFAPVAPDDINRSAHHHTTVSTRRSSKSGPLLALGHDEKSVAHTTHSPVRPPPPPRTSSRKRPAAALDDAPNTFHPPTKVTVTQPHGELVRITNGVQTLLGVDADDVPSGRSTPRPGSAGKLAVPPPAVGPKSRDRRSLRSSDGGSRLKSDLAVYFSSYDDIIAGLPKPSGTPLAAAALLKPCPTLPDLACRVTRHRDPHIPRRRALQIQATCTSLAQTSSHLSQSNTNTQTKTPYTSRTILHHLSSARLQLHSQANPQ